MKRLHRHAYGSSVAVAQSMGEWKRAQAVRCAASGLEDLQLLRNCMHCDTIKFFSTFSKTDAKCTCHDTPRILVRHFQRHPHPDREPNNLTARHSLRKQPVACCSAVQGGSIPS